MILPKPKTNFVLCVWIAALLFSQTGFSGYEVSVRVSDENHTPVNHIFLRPDIPRRGEITQSEQFDPNGQFRIAPGAIVWAEGKSRRLFTPDIDSTRKDVYELTLTAESPLTIRCTDREGKNLRLDTFRPLYCTDSALQVSPVPHESGEDTSVTVFRSLPPGNYAIDVGASFADGLRSTTRLYANLVPGEAQTMDVLFGPPPIGSGEAILLNLREQGRGLNDQASESLWNQLPESERQLSVGAALDLVARMPCFLDYQDYFLYKLLTVSQTRESLPHLARIYAATPESRNTQVMKEFPFALATLGGNEAIPYLVNAARKSGLSSKRRSLAIMALNRIGTTESLTAWRDMCKNFRPRQRPEGFTHVDGMKSALELTLHALPESTNRPIPMSGATVDADFQLGKMRVTNEEGIGYVEYILHRQEDEWLVVDIGIELVI